MTTYNHVAHNLHDAGYQVSTSDRILGVIRMYTNMVIGGSRSWLGSRHGLEADTRQIRNHGRSSAPGACEVRLGLRLAT